MATKSRAPTRFEQAKLRRQARERFNYAQKVEQHYGRQLRSVAGHINVLLRDMGLHYDGPERIQNSLRSYSLLLAPWAEVVGTQMAARIAAHDAKAWRTSAAEIGMRLRTEQFSGVQLEQAMRVIVEQQKRSITQLPLSAAQRVQELAIQGVFKGQRAAVISRHLAGVGGYTKAVANTIARTNTSTAASAVVEVRAKALGSVTYVWRSSEDSDVRHRHKELNGKRFRWDTPPICSEDGKRGHPGQDYQCRCYPEPDLPSD